MTFLYPLGFLILLLVPLLVIIYIIKNKYTEQVVPATYLWTLSEKFLKRKNPISKLAGILNLILQILAVIVVAFAVAHPVFTVPGGAHDYLFILDGSGSMTIRDDGSTRFDRAKASVKDVINSSAGGSTYTLVLAGDSADTVFEDVTDKRRAWELIDSIEPRYTDSSIASAISAAQKRFDANTSILTYLFTDKAVERAENVTVINVAASCDNYAVSDVKCEIKRGMTVTGNVISYASDAALDLSFYADGAAVGNSTVEVKAGELTPFTFTEPDIAKYSFVRVAIDNPDALGSDSEITVFNTEKTSAYKTLIVSEKSPNLITAVIGATNSEVIAPKEYDETRTGYGLYVFDSFAPAVTPKDGAVWFFDPPTSSENSGFTVQNRVEPITPALLSYSNSSASTVRKILENVIKNDVRVAKYQKCGTYRSFHTILSCGADPVVFAGTNTFGNREVVFAFGLGETDFALSTDFVVLSDALLAYTFPPVLEKAVYTAGETVTVNVPAGCASIRVDTPLGSVAYLDTGADTAQYTLEETGVYDFTLTIGGTARKANLSSVLPEKERQPLPDPEPAFVISGTAGGASRDGVFDDLLFAFIVLAVIVVADWAVYCYEQYQLR